jgi:hypothetical protein
MVADAKRRDATGLGGNLQQLAWAAGGNQAAVVACIPRLEGSRTERWGPASLETAILRIYRG